MRWFNEVAKLMEVLDGLPEDHPVRNDPAFKAVKKRRYVRVPRIIAITRPEQVGGFDGGDFSPEAIKKHADEGYAQTEQALKLTAATTRR